MKTLLRFWIFSSLLLGISSLSLINCHNEEPLSKRRLPIETVEIPAGAFIMGSPLTELGRKEDESEHAATVSAFSMSKYEITNSEFAAFLNAEKVDRYGIHPKGDELKHTLVNLNTSCGVWYENNQWVPVTGYENHPVVNVTWYGAMEFALWVGGRLPTEAEWEYACRGNTKTAFNTGDCLSDAQGNYEWALPYNSCSNANSSRPFKTLAVGTYPANAFGLHDAHGNVWEWCIDSYGGNPGLRIIRGGSWIDEAGLCRSANRVSLNSEAWSTAGTEFPNIGLRVAFD